MHNDTFVNRKTEYYMGVLPAVLWGPGGKTISGDELCAQQTHPISDRITWNIGTTRARVWVYMLRIIVLCHVAAIVSPATSHSLGYTIPGLE